MTPRLLSVDIQTWANRLSNYLDTIKDKLSFRVGDSNASENGIILWDDNSGYPVVSKNGEWRQIVLADGKFSALATTQTAALANTPYTIPWVANLSDGISVSASGAITVSKPGFYTISFSAQILATSSSDKSFYFWPRINGADMTDSAIKETTHSNGQTKIVSRSVLMELSENDTIEALWAVSDTDGRLDATPATTFCPACPAATIKMFRVCQ